MSAASAADGVGRPLPLSALVTTPAVNLSVARRVLGANINTDTAAAFLNYYARLSKLLLRSNGIAAPQLSEITNLS